MNSKEKLRPPSGGLAVVNRQLQEALERQRATSNDLQNVLFSTDVATIFLDVDFKIRLFTPATKLLFKIVPGDIGRHLADLDFLAVDALLMDDAKKVLGNSESVEREIEAQSGAWYLRRILPYRTQANEIEGVVVTFADMSHQKKDAKALSGARLEADTANAAKSRFLAVASHDLRQPLQTLVLLQELLAKVVEGERAKKLVVRLEQTLSGMSGMLNALLDINKIEAGAVRAEMTTFQIDVVLDRLAAELGYQAEAQRRPQPSPWSDKLDQMLIANEGKASGAPATGD